MALFDDNIMESRTVVVWVSESACVVGIDTIHKVDVVVTVNLSTCDNGNSTNLSETKTQTRIS